MTIYNKPSDLPAWAESGDKVQPTNAEIQTGWPLSTVPPSRQRFNWLLNWLATGVRYFMQRGIPEWDITEEYPAGARVQYNNVTYVSLTGTSNVGQQPDTATTFWERWGYSATELSAFNDAYLSKSVAGGTNVTLTSAEAQKAIFNFTGVLTANINVIIPASAKRFVVRNNTSGAFTLTVKTSDGTGVAVAQGSNTTLYCDGTNVDFSTKTGETTAQFDNDTSLATTEFVQRALGNARTLQQVSTATVLGGSDAGKSYIVAGAGGIDITLPVLTSTPSGSKFEIINTATAAINVIRAGTDIIVVNNGATKTSITLNTGDSLVIESQGSQWVVLGGSAQLKFAGVFGALLSANGYQKLPSGLIIQWGTGTTSSGLLAVTFPIAFPNLCVNATPSYYAGSLLGDRAVINASIPTNSGTTFYFATNSGAAVAPANVKWFAIGY